jgi:hypothetical protein
MYEGHRELPDRRHPERKNYDRPAIAASGGATDASRPAKDEYAPCIGRAGLA